MQMLFTFLPGTLACMLIVASVPRYFGAAGCIFANTTICCSPGPALEPSTTLPNCLIIGDSVSDQCVRPSNILSPCFGERRVNNRTVLANGADVVAWPPCACVDVTNLGQTWYPLWPLFVHIFLRYNSSVPPFVLDNISLAAMREKQSVLCFCLQRHGQTNPSHRLRRSPLLPPSRAYLASRRPMSSMLAKTTLQPLT